MRVLVIGSEGFVGVKLVDKFLTDAEINGRAIKELILADVIAPSMPLEDAPFKVQLVKLDISDAAQMNSVIESRPDVIFHLVEVMSGEDEANFSKGYATNVDSTHKLLETIRLMDDYKPRFIFTSSWAVFGPLLPDVVPDSQACTPASSYGTQKAIVELLINDYSRRGCLDGVCIRLPTIVVRPYQPNKAASSFISSIIRDPIANMEAICPVPLTFRHPVASARAAVGFLVRAASLTSEDLEGGRCLTMPSLSVTVGEMIESLENVTGKHAVELIKHEPDEVIHSIAEKWPKEFDAKRALSLGFEADLNFDSIIESYIDDDLGGWKYHLPAGMKLKPISTPTKKSGGALMA